MAHLTIPDTRASQNGTKLLNAAGAGWLPSCGECRMSHCSPPLGKVELVGQLQNTFGMESEILT